MTPNERIMAALTGKETDRPAWSPFLAYWWDIQNEERKTRGQLEFMESIGCDPMLRGFGMSWKMDFKGLNVRHETKPGWRYEFWETPVGTLSFGYRRSEQGNTWFLVEHPIREAEDLKILSWLYEHAELESNREADDEVKKTGDRGVVLPIIGTESKTCFQSLVEKWVGIQNLTYLLADEPEAVEDCLAAMRRVSDQTAVYDAQSRADAFIFWEDSSTTSISPAMFRKYTMPEISAWAKTLHSSGKLLVHHACGHLRALLPLMAEAGADVIESISPPTTGNIDIPEAFTLLPENVALVGGIEPVFFENCSGEQLDERVFDLLNSAKGRRFVLANSDSCPPKVAEWKFTRVSKLVKEWK